MYKKRLLIINFILSVFIALMCFDVSAEPVKISVQQAKKMIDAKDYGLILDVRTDEEFVGELGHIEGAKLIPVQELKERVGEIEKYKDRKVLVICHSGNRSTKASNFLSQKGFSQVFNIVDGMAGWDDQKYPVKRD
jgi:rhodanese-related sulfurtransferase